MSLCFRISKDSFVFASIRFTIKLLCYTTIKEVLAFLRFFSCWNRTESIYWRVREELIGHFSSIWFSMKLSSSYFTTWFKIDLSHNVLESVRNHLLLPIWLCLRISKSELISFRIIWFIFESRHSVLEGMQSRLFLPFSTLNQIKWSQWRVACFSPIWFQSHRFLSKSVQSHLFLPYLTPNQI